MKRTPLKRSTSLVRKKPVQRQTGAKKRVKKTPEKKLKEELWELCKIITRKTYGNTCYTCPAINLQGANWHTGHFIPSSVCGLYLRYDLRNLRPQCYRCNINLAGNGSVFYRRLLSELGPDYVNQLFKDKELITKSTKEFYTDLILTYQQKVKELG